MRKNLTITPIAMFLASGAMILTAQDMTTGTLAGRVTGPDGRPLQGVSVTLNSPSLLAPRQFTTDASGQFRAQMLMGGNYTITYSLRGYLSRRLNTYVTAGQIIRGDMQLRPVDVQAVEVDIVATSSQQVDKTDTIVQTSFSQGKLLELLGSTSVGSLLAVSSGITPALRVRGGLKSGIKIMIDGSNVTNMAEGNDYAVMYPLTDAVESAAVIQSPMNARYGNTDGGMISYVLGKGSNEFKGTVRVGLNRGNIWNVFNPYDYPNNRGERSTNNPGQDTLGKQYDFYLSGPLWKDHITFTWTSQIYPLEKWYNYQYEITPDIWVGGNGSAYHPSRYKNGTYFENPDKPGEVVRRAEMLEANDPYNIIPASYRYTYDAYTLFFQISQNHQLEWSYGENLYYAINYSTGFKMADAASNPNRESFGDVRRWNIAYKGVIGSNGLLEARWAGSTQSWFNTQADRRPKRTVNVLTMPSLTPFTGADDNNPNNYYASGLIDATLPRLDSVKDSTFGGISDYNFNATNQGAGDASINDPINVNYQHILQTTRGQHIIDVGFQRERASWEKPNLYSGQGGNINGEMLVKSPGRIASDLRPGEIFNYSGTPMSYYVGSQGGKFIVFNMNYATFNSIDPYGFSRYNKGSAQDEPTDPNELLYNENGRSNVTAIWPQMYRQYGSTVGGLSVQQVSYYLNDLWTINDHHSVMGGVRYDSYKLWDIESGRDIFSYSLPTFRFDYKFDLGGDQKRVFNISWGQFHNMSGVGTWTAFTNRTITRAIWNEGRIDGKPYLVDFDEIMDPRNYRVITTESFGGTNEVAKGFKGSVSTELTLGVRFNLDNGGSIRAAYVTRSWANDAAYLFNGLKDNPNGGAKLLSRLLTNIDQVKRSYNSFELEWTIPVTKRVDFGGTYTYSRNMSNALGGRDGRGESDSPEKTATKSINYWDYYNELYSETPSLGWKVMRLQDPEQRFNAYINYDLTYGKVRSNVALRFNYVSAAPATRGYYFMKGVPSVPGLNDNLAGVGLPNGTGLNRYVYDYMNINRTAGPDGWSTDLTYNLEVPVTRKLRWFAIITSSNPFNHRAKNTNWYSTDGFNGSYVYPENIYRPDGTLLYPAAQPYAAGGYYFVNGVQRAGANLFAPNRVVDGRTIGLTTGLRF